MDNFFVNNQLKKLIDELYEGDIAAFGKALGQVKNKEKATSPQTLNVYLKNEQILGKGFINVLVERLGINKKWLLKGEGEMLISETNKSENTDRVDETQISASANFKIEVLPVPANAGRGYLFEPTTLFMEVTNQYNDKKYKAVRIKGESMSPEIPDESMIIYDATLQPQHGNIIIALVDNVLMCKRYETEKNTDDRYLTSVNKNYKKIKINGFNNTQILGVGIEVRKSLK